LLSCITTSGYLNGSGAIQSKRLEEGNCSNRPNTVRIKSANDNLKASHRELLNILLFFWGLDLPD
jgi:hypothetical protein